MYQQKPDDNGKPLRRLRIERREAEARGRGWTGSWPPEKPHIESAADCEHYLARLEEGELRAGFLAAVGSKLVAFFRELKPEHFRRFAAVLLEIAEDSGVAHRSRLRAVEAAIRPLRRAVTILPKLQKAGDGALQTHLESLLMAFCEALSAEHFGGLARVLVELTGPAARTTTDRLRAIEAALTAVTNAMAMLSELQVMQQQCPAEIDENHPAVQEAERELREIEAEVAAELEEVRRTGKPVRRDWRGQRIDGGE